MLKQFPVTATKPLWEVGIVPGESMADEEKAEQLRDVLMAFRLRIASQATPLAAERLSGDAGPTARRRAATGAVVRADSTGRTQSRGGHPAVAQ